MPATTIRSISGSLRKAGFWTLVTVSSVLMANEMAYITEAIEQYWLRWPMFLLFVVCFTWICVPFWVAVLGLITIVFRIDPLALEKKRPLNKPSATLHTRTAVVMPVYSESPEGIFGALAAMYDALQRWQGSELFDFFVLSDTRDAQRSARELELWNALRAEGRSRMFYRRRENNTGKKAGNIEDFVTSWGSAYEYMLVLDADSVMTPETIHALALLMQANPNAALIQTSPSVIYAETLFARLIQFTSRLYGRLFSYGAAFWHGADSNYWGHNAIIRIAAFRTHCGLGELRGPPPLGGPILSHDFVEAALLASAGWGIYMVPALEGSYEQIPPTPVEYLQRDKRWSQGNLQHLKLVLEPELTISSRTFFLLGAFAYVSSPLWLLLLALSTIDTVVEKLIEHNYFPQEHQLFPTWPISRQTDALLLFILTAVVLFTPKIGGLCLTLFDDHLRHRFGGARALITSVIMETLFFVLFAPTMMMFHSGFVLLTLSGRRVPWNPQNRSATGLTLKDAFRSTGWISIIGACWIALLAFVDAPSLVWMSPVLGGLLVAPFLVWFASSSKLGQRTLAAKLFLTPEEKAPSPLLLDVQRRSEMLVNVHFTGTPAGTTTPPIQFEPMPQNPLFEQGSSGSNGRPGGSWWNKLWAARR